MLNRIIVMGRLVRDPELRTTQSGVSVTSFTLAVDRDFKSRDSGEKSTDFIDVVAWRQTAEFVCKYFAKGRMAIAEGRLQIRDWKDRDGNNRRSAEVVADNVYFGDSKRDSAGDGYGSPPDVCSSDLPRPPLMAGDTAAAMALPLPSLPALRRSMTRMATCPSEQAVRSRFETSIRRKPDEPEFPAASWWRGTLTGGK